MSGTVMVVDDDLDCIEMLEAILSLEGYTVVGCPRSADALVMAREECPDVMVVDIVMPDKTGLRVIEEMKADSETARIPVIVCTAISPTQLRLGREAISRWGCQVLHKPFEIDELLTAVKQATRLDGSEGTTA